MVPSWDLEVDGVPLARAAHRRDAPRAVLSAGAQFAPINLAAAERARRVYLFARLQIRDVVLKRCCPSHGHPPIMRVGTLAYSVGTLAAGARPFGLAARGRSHEGEPSIVKIY